MVAGPVSITLAEIILTVGALSAIVVELLGLFSLGYYGLRLSSSEPSALENINAQRWSGEVKYNIEYTYVYLFASFYICIMAALIVFSNPAMLAFFTSPFTVIVDFFIESVIQYGKTFCFLDSTGFFSYQRLAWFAYCSFLGGLASPAMLLGSKTVKISIHVTMFNVFTLTIISLIAPFGRFASWDKNLRISEIIVVLSTIGGVLFPLTTPTGALCFSISIYGGLVLFQLFYLCHSQQAHAMAQEGMQNSPYCPLAMSIPMLLDTISIFSRMIIIVPPT